MTLPANLNAAEQKGVDVLESEGQTGLFTSWQAGDEEKQRAFLRSVGKMDGQYPGGLRAYREKARALLEASRVGANPMNGVVPHVPEGTFMPTHGDALCRYEQRGVQEVRHAAFVLVAGGLGERLGYDGIKIALPTNLLTEESYLAMYCQWIKVYEAAAGCTAIPLVIMTSGDTHEQTVRLLTQNAYFGLAPSQVDVVKQEKVPAVRNNDADLATSANDPYSLLTKPHGNGDVHLLLHQSGIAKKWADAGRKWVVFFQDTNGLAFNTVLPTLGFSATKGHAMTSVAVPRVAGEAIGCITLLKRANGTSVVCNVEYNQIDPLLRAVSGGKQGDVADPATGFSAYPGNINTLVMAVPRYVEVLDESGGVMPEFINPKYANKARTEFKSPTRLECMMEDYPLLLRQNDSVGFASFDRWASFSPCKNNLKDAAAKSAAGEYAWGAFSAEADFYRYNVNLLRALGVATPAATKRALAGVSEELPALVWLSPAFLGLRSTFPKKLRQPHRVSITARSALVVDGADIVIDALRLDGALVIEACEGAHVHIRNLTVTNKGWDLEELSTTHTSAVKQIRGYHIMKRDQMVWRVLETTSFFLHPQTQVLRFTRPGAYVVDDTAKL